MHFETKADMFQKMKRKLKRTGDRLGRPIDEGIFDVVLYLNLLGIETEASCEGHLDHGVAAPWIDFVPPTTALYRKLQKKADVQYESIRAAVEEGDTQGHIQTLQMAHGETMERISILLKQSIQPVMKLLSEFYTQHRCNYEYMLTFRNAWQFARLTNVGEMFQDIRDKNEQKKHLIHYQKEMQEFMSFLRMKWEGN